MVGGYYLTQRVDPAHNEQVLYGGVGPAWTPSKVPNPDPLGIHTVWSYRTKEPVEHINTTQRAMFDASRVNSMKSATDTGHPFWVQHDSINGSRYLDLRNPSNQSIFQGRLYAIPTTGALGLNFNSEIGTQQFQAHTSKGQLETWGTSAIKQTQPTAPHANVAQLMAESVMDLPKIPFIFLKRTWLAKGDPTFRAERDLKKTSRDVGGEYLNQQFGWIPFVRDLTKYLHAVVNTNKILTDYMNGSGGAPKQWHQNPVTTVVKSVESGEFSAAPNGSMFLNWNSEHGERLFVPGSAKSYTHQIHTYGWKFSGAYSYLFPEGTTFIDNMRRFEQNANVLLGTRITPELIWELTPWSWLIDWWAQIGSFITVNSRFQQSDNLVLQYGYLTAFSAQRTLCTAEITARTGQRISFNTLYESKRRERVAATPYGFAVNLDMLNAQQLGILAAFGASRFPR